MKTIGLQPSILNSWNSSDIKIKDSIPFSLLVVALYYNGKVKLIKIGFVMVEEGCWKPRRLESLSLIVVFRHLARQVTKTDEREEYRLHLQQEYLTDGGMAQTGRILGYVPMTEFDGQVRHPGVTESHR